MNMKTTMSVIVSIASCVVFAASAVSPSAVFEKVKSVGDSVCTVSGDVAMTNGIALVSFTLKPETLSDIRCRIALPPPEKWNGEFWGEGNSSFGGTGSTGREPLACA